MSRRITSWQSQNWSVGKIMNNQVDKIQVRINQYDGRAVKQIELFMKDLIFFTDVKSDRDIKLAQLIADDNDIELHRIDKLQEQNQPGSHK